MNFSLLLSLSAICVSLNRAIRCYTAIAEILPMPVPVLLTGTAIDDDVFWVLCAMCCCTVRCVMMIERLNLTPTKSVNVCAHSLDGVCDRTVALHYIIFARSELR